MGFVHIRAFKEMVNKDMWKKAQRSEIQRGGGGEDVRASQVEEQKGRMTQKKAAEGVNLSVLGGGESAVMRWCRRSFWKSPFSSNHMELQEHHHHHHHHHQVYSHFCHFPIAPGRLQYEASALRTRAKLETTPGCHQGHPTHDPQLPSPDTSDRRQRNANWGGREIK